MSFTPLKWMTKMSDREVWEDIECVVSALNYQHEGVVARGYRRARSKAPGWYPKYHTSNHDRLPDAWKNPEKLAQDVLEAMSAEGHKDSSAAADVLAKITGTALKGSKKCSSCEQPFKAKRKDARYCSPACRQRGRRA